MSFFPVSFGFVFIIAIALLIASIKVVNQYERGVVLTLGKFTSVATPGLNLLVPLIQTMRRADVRITVINVPAQDVITSDNVSVKVSAVAYFKIVDARKALLEVANYRDAISQLAQITLRSNIGKHPLADVLSEQDKLNAELGKALVLRTQDWGVDVDHVEIRSVDLDPSMIRAMGQAAEAERGRQARIITAQGEFEAATKLAAAADILASSPAALTLRTLATMKEIGAEHNSTIIFPVAQENMMAPAISGAVLAQALANRASTQGPSQVAPRSES